ncbi:PGAP1-like protein-domain-containing protein [Polychytrium aggregatum]|uniref:PGAP1-like protein-domain-containing protein n=1 Tax=Polychytrium aggregatum TaxID=110093 RepID=UPI0022FE7A74|nr:PGAP1-like protein-domain-containing protein [Polychytrium aggregatum]KAI9197459.1 PGAP1-like protein-domain-containing protein [Polychytrium aggregatum]
MRTRQILLSLALLLAVAASLVSWLVLAKDRRRCILPYMYPYFHQIDFGPPHPRYRLFWYMELPYGMPPSSPVPAGHPVLFIPGHAGSYEQARSLGSRAHYQHQRLMFGGPDTSQIPFDVFTVDTQEELTAFGEDLVLQQAEYVNEAIAHILSLYRSHDSGQPQPSSVMVVAHSMGGIVVRVAMTLPSHRPGSVDTIFTLSTPHLAPPASFAPGMAQLYSRVNRIWGQGGFQKHAPGFENVSLVSIAGGNQDHMIRSELSEVEAFLPHHHGFTVYTTSIPEVWTSIEHEAIVWCSQLLHKLVQAMFSARDPHRALRTRDLSSRMQVLEATFLGGLGRRSGARSGQPQHQPSSIVVRAPQEAAGPLFVETGQPASRPWLVLDLGNVTVTTVLLTNHPVEGIYSCESGDPATQEYQCHPIEHRAAVVPYTAPQAPFSLVSWDRRMRAHSKQQWIAIDRFRNYQSEYPDMTPMGSWVAMVAVGDSGGADLRLSSLAWATFNTTDMYVATTAPWIRNGYIKYALEYRRSTHDANDSSDVAVTVHLWANDTSDEKYHTIACSSRRQSVPLALERLGVNPVHPRPSGLGLHFIASPTDKTCEFRVTIDYIATLAEVIRTNWQRILEYALLVVLDASGRTAKSPKRSGMQTAAFLFVVLLLKPAALHDYVYVPGTSLGEIWTSRVVEMTETAPWNSLNWHIAWVSVGTYRAGIGAASVIQGIAAALVAAARRLVPPSQRLERSLITRVAALGLVLLVVATRLPLFFGFLVGLLSLIANQASRMHNRRTAQTSTLGLCTLSTLISVPELIIWAKAADRSANHIKPMIVVAAATFFWIECIFHDRIKLIGWRASMYSGAIQAFLAAWVVLSWGDASMLPAAIGALAALRIGLSVLG